MSATRIDDAALCVGCHLWYKHVSQCPCGVHACTTCCSDGVFHDCVACGQCVCSECAAADCASCGGCVCAACATADGTCGKHGK